MTATATASSACRRRTASTPNRLKPLAGIEPRPVQRAAPRARTSSRPGTRACATPATIVAIAIGPTSSADQHAAAATIDAVRSPRGDRPERRVAEVRRGRAPAARRGPVISRPPSRASAIVAGDRRRGQRQVAAARDLPLLAGVLQPFSLWVFLCLSRPPSRLPERPRPCRAPSSISTARAASR